MARPRNDTPFRITQIRQLPCEDVGAVYRQVWARVLGVSEGWLGAKIAELLERERQSASTLDRGSTAGGTAEAVCLDHEEP